MPTKCILHGKKLTTVEFDKYLHVGVLIDFKLRFNQHIDNVCKIVNSVLDFVKRNFISLVHIK